MNGWWLEAAPGALPARFRLDYSEEPDGPAWRQVGSSGYVWAWAGYFVWTDAPYAGRGQVGPPAGGRPAVEVLFDICLCALAGLLRPRRALKQRSSLARAQEVRFDMSVPGLWAVHHVGSRALGLALFACLLVAAASRNQLAGRAVYVTSFCVLTAFRGAVALRAAAMGDLAFAFMAGSFALNNLFIMLVAAVAEHWIWQGYLYTGLGFMLTTAAYYAAIGHPDGLLRVRTNVGFLDGLILLILSLYTRFAVARLRRAARRMVAPDMQAYAASWDRIQARSPAALRRLRSLTQSLASRLPAEIRQRDRPPPPPPWLGNVEASSGWLRLGAGLRWFGEGAVVGDLERLLTQAAGLDAFLKVRVQKWALAAGGLFQVAAPPCSSEIHLPTFPNNTKKMWPKIKQHNVF